LTPRFGDPAVVVSKKNFAERTARSFKVKVRGEEVQGLVVRLGDKFYAYQNLCQHLPVTLDLNDAKFFTHDKAHLQCHLHGAMYQIETGLCIAGPCEGANLIRFGIEEEEDRLVIRVPESVVQK